MPNFTLGMHARAPTHPFTHVCKGTNPCTHVPTHARKGTHPFSWIDQAKDTAKRWTDAIKASEGKKALHTSGGEGRVRCPDLPALPWPTLFLPFLLHHHTFCWPRPWQSSYVFVCLCAFVCMPRMCMLRMCMRGSPGEPPEAADPYGCRCARCSACLPAKGNNACT